jgi:myosin heavy subunit
MREYYIRVPGIVTRENNPNNPSVVVQTHMLREKIEMELDCSLVLHRQNDSLIGGEEVQSRKASVSYNPSKHSSVVHTSEPVHTVHDMTDLVHLNDASVLYNIMVRFRQVRIMA